MEFVDFTLVAMTFCWIFMVAVSLCGDICRCGECGTEIRDTDISSGYFNTMAEAVADIRRKMNPEVAA